MNVLIGFASMSGNTEEIMDIIKNQLEKKGCQIKLEEIETLNVQDIPNYDLVLIGSYTWGDGDLPYEAEEFYEDLDNVDLKGSICGCFGSGDTVYPAYCQAVNLFSEKLQERGANVFETLLKIEFSPDTREEVEECENYANSLYQWAEQELIISRR
ncbi:flavodoxin [Bacillus sp. B1-b2]|nr:flavodoxin [Bacillus sp. B1-b2]